MLFAFFFLVNRIEFEFSAQRNFLFDSRNLHKLNRVVTHRHCLDQNQGLESCTIFLHIYNFRYKMSRISNDDIYDIVAVNFNEDSDDEVTLDYSRTYSKMLNPGNTPKVIST